MTEERCPYQLDMGDEVASCERKKDHTKAHSGTYHPATEVRWLDDEQQAVIDREREAREAERLRQAEAWKALPFWRKVTRVRREP